MSMTYEELKNIVKQLIENGKTKKAKEVIRKEIFNSYESEKFLTDMVIQFSQKKNCFTQIASKLRRKLWEEALKIAEDNKVSVIEWNLLAKRFGISVL